MSTGGPAPAGRPRRTLVKVCGLTRFEDAALALECGADWLGFIVAASGPRHIEPERMADILARLPADAVGVAIAMQLDPDEALAVARRAGARRLQLHRCDPSIWPPDFPLPCAFVTSIDGAGVAHGALAPPPHLIQFDTAHDALAGGTGQVFPWRRAGELAGERPFVLAGGLGPDNVATALAAVAPYAVDASSRLESVPGVKDPQRVRRFVAAVREFESRDFETA